MDDDEHTNAERESPSDQRLPKSLLTPKYEPKRAAKYRLLHFIDSKVWATALILPLIPILGFAVWLPFNGRNISLESKSIGGKGAQNFTQVQAKTIDFLCSVIAAPCVITVFDFLWFSYARVLVINEAQPKTGIPIEILASTSSTNCGSFDMLKVWGLVKTGKWTLWLFAFLILFSGMTRSLLSNIIAYEASSIMTSGTTLVSLQSLNGIAGEWWTGEPVLDVFYIYGYTIQQTANFSSQFFGLLAGICFYPSTDKLEDKSCIGINATAASLNSLPSSIGSLTDVPGYRLSIGCRATTPTGLSFYSADGLTTLTLQVTNDSELITGDKSATLDSERFSYIAAWTGGLEAAFGNVATQDGFGWTTFGPGTYPFVGFSNQLDYKLYLGWLGVYPLESLGGLSNSNNSGIDSSYGTLKWYYSNQTNGTSDEPSLPHNFYAWGVACNVTRQAGLHTLQRADDGSWERIVNASWYENETTLPELYISELAFDLAFKAPFGASMPGYGTVFATSAVNCSYWPSCDTGLFDGNYTTYGATASPTNFSYETTVLNALYAIGETNRMLNDIGMQNRGTNDTFQVTGGLLEQRYHITYVPLLFFGSLLSCLFACLITFGLLVYHGVKKTHSFRKWRKVTVTRLLADIVDGFRAEKSFRNLSDRDNTELREWGDDYKVRYVEGKDEAGIKIVLEKGET